MSLDRAPISLVTQVSMAENELLEADEKTSLPNHFQPLVNIVFKDLETAKTALKLIQSTTAITDSKILEKMLVRHRDGNPMFWCESPYIIENISKVLLDAKPKILVNNELVEARYIDRNQYDQLIKYAQLCKRKLRTINHNIERIRIDDIQLLFRLIDDGDPTALEMYKNKLNHHKLQVLSEIEQYINIIKKNGMNFFFRFLQNESDDSVFLSPTPLSKKDFQQLLDLRFLNQSYHTLQLLDATLLEILRELKKLCDLALIPHTFQEFIFALEKSIRTIRKDESTIDDLIYKALKLDDLDAFMSIPDHKTMANKTIGKNETPIIIEAAHYACAHIFKFLVENKADLKAVSAAGENVLTAACTTSESYLRLEKPRLAIVKFLIEQCSFNVNAEGSDGQTALHKAVSANFDDMVKYLLSVHADSNLPCLYNLADEPTVLSIKVPSSNKSFEIKYMGSPSLELKKSDIQPISIKPVRLRSSKLTRSKSDDLIVRKSIFKKHDSQPKINTPVSFPRARNR